MDKSKILSHFTKRFSTIIFDLDNTLIATRKADLKTCNKVIKDAYNIFFGNSLCIEYDNKVYTLF